MAQEQRRARRVAVSLPALIEAIGQPDVALHPTVQAVYQRVEADRAAVGHTGPGIVRDLSTNGAFIAGEPLPLLSRVRVGFELPHFGAVEAIGWVLWVRTKDCEIADALGDPVPLPRGIGILFESLAIEARVHIAKLARCSRRPPTRCSRRSRSRRRAPGSSSGPPRPTSSCRRSAAAASASAWARSTPTPGAPPATTRWPPPPRR